MSMHDDASFDKWADYVVETLQHDDWDEARCWAESLDDIDRLPKNVPNRAEKNADKHADYRTLFCEMRDLQVWLDALFYRYGHMVEHVRFDEGDNAQYFINGHQATLIESVAEAAIHNCGLDDSDALLKGKGVEYGYNVMLCMIAFTAYIKSLHLPLITDFFEFIRDPMIDSFSPIEEIRSYDQWGY